MGYRIYSEIPFIRGGDAREDDRDSLSAMHFNPVWNGTEYVCFWRGETDLETNPSKPSDVLMRGVIRPGDNTGTPMSMIRDIDRSSNPVQADGDSYIFEWDTGVGNITGWGTPPIDDLGKNVDFSVEKWDNGGTEEWVMLVGVSNYPTGSATRMGRLVSTDQGMNWTVTTEALRNGVSFFKYPGNVFVVDNVFYMMVTTPGAGGANDGKTLHKSTDGGANWTELYKAITFGPDEDWPDFTNCPIGRATVRNGVVYVFQNASQFDDDWPKCTLMYYRNVADLETPGEWDTTYFPVSGVEPIAGGEWQLNDITINGEDFGILNTWAHVGSYWLNSNDHVISQDTPYWGNLRKVTFKSIIAKNLRWSGMWDNPDYVPFTDGETVRLKNIASGLYLAPSGEGEPVKMSEKPHEWTVSLKVRFALFRSGDLYLDYSDDEFRPYQSPICTRIVDDEPGDYRKHWIPLLDGPGRPNRCALMNRRNRYVIHHLGLMGPDRGSDMDVFQIERA